MMHFNWNKIGKVLIILIIFSIGWRIFNQQMIKQEKQFKFFLRTVRRPNGDYLKIILLSVNRLPVEKLSLITPNSEIVDLKINDFKRSWLMRALISKELKLNAIPPGVYHLKVYYKNNTILVKKTIFVPHYINFPKNLEVEDSIVSWDFDDSVLAYAIEIREINGKIIWQSDYIPPHIYTNIYYLDTRRLEDGKEYKIRIKNYDRDLTLLSPFVRVYSNENVSDFKRFYYHKSSLQLISWRVQNIAFKDFISTQKGIYRIRVRINNPWAIKKIICTGPEGKNYKLYWGKSRSSYSAFAHRLKDGIYTLKICPAKGRPIIVKKQFLFDTRHNFPDKLNYKNRKISWQGSIEANSYQVWIYEEDNTGHLFLRKSFGKITDNSISLKEKNLVKGREYCFRVAALKTIYDGKTVNINMSFSPLHYFTFY